MCSGLLELRPDLILPQTPNACRSLWFLFGLQEQTGESADIIMFSFVSYVAERNSNITVAEMELNEPGIELLQERTT